MATMDFMSVEELDAWLCVWDLKEWVESPKFKKLFVDKMEQKVRGKREVVEGLRWLEGKEKEREEGREEREREEKEKGEEKEKENDTRSSSNNSNINQQQKKPEGKAPTSTSTSTSTSSKQPSLSPSATAASSTTSPRARRTSTIVNTTCSKMATSTNTRTDTDTKTDYPPPSPLHPLNAATPLEAALFKFNAKYLSPLVGESDAFAAWAREHLEANDDRRGKVRPVCVCV